MPPEIANPCILAILTKQKIKQATQNVYEFA